MLTHDPVHAAKSWHLPLTCFLIGRSFPNGSLFLVPLHCWFVLDQRSTLYINIKLIEVKQNKKALYWHLSKVTTGEVPEADLNVFLTHRRSKGRSTVDACPHYQDARVLGNAGKRLVDTCPRWCQHPILWSGSSMLTIVPYLYHRCYTLIG